MSLTITAESPPLPGALLYRRKFQSTLAAKDQAVGELMQALRRLGVVSCVDDLFRYRLCTEEVIQNAIVHGNRGDASRNVEVALFDAGHRWGLAVSDEGEGFAVEEIPDNSGREALYRERGRGIWIVREYMDELRYYNGGRTAVLLKDKRQSWPESSALKN